MPDLTRGANAPLTSTSLTIAVSGAKQGAVDVMAFQLGADRRVRSDADFVFFNQTASSEGALRLSGPGRLTVELARMPAGIEVIAIAVALDDSVTGSLSSIPGLAVSVTGQGESYTAATDGLTSERAAVLIELYLRAGTWKVRNVSAGWVEGLGALAREHGVSVDDEPVASPPTGGGPVAAPGPVAVPAPPVTPSRPVSRSEVPATTSGPWPTAAPSLDTPPPFQAPIRTTSRSFPT